MIKNYIKTLIRFRRNSKGAAAVEMALIAPVIISLILGSTELALYLVAHQKISRAASTISNLMTQMDEGISESQISDLMLAFDEVSKPLDFSTNGKAIVSAIIGIGVDGAAPDSYTVAWQRCYGNSATSLTSIFGVEGDDVTTSNLPAQTITTTSQIMVSTEVSYVYTPLLNFLPLSDTISYQAYFRPRLGSIETIIQDITPIYGC